jgi:hypothetical protein
MENNICTLLDSHKVWTFVFLGFVALLLFLARSFFIIRLRNRDNRKYKELGEPTFSDVYGTKAGRALLSFLWHGKSRTYEDRALNIYAWLTLFLFIFGNAVMVLIICSAVYCE